MTIVKCRKPRGIIASRDQLPKLRLLARLMKSERHGLEGVEQIIIGPIEKSRKPSAREMREYYSHYPLLNEYRLPRERFIHGVGGLTIVLPSPSYDFAERFLRFDSYLLLKDMMPYLDKGKTFPKGKLQDGDGLASEFDNLASLLDKLDEYELVNTSRGIRRGSNYGTARVLVLHVNKQDANSMVWNPPYFNIEAWRDRPYPR